MKYFVLDGYEPPCRWIDESPYFEGLDFDLGRKIKVDVPTPLEFTLEEIDPDGDDSGPTMPSAFVDTIPLFSDDLIDALRAAGVDNLDLYDAVIQDPENDARYENYKAANIIGVIAAADMALSNATVHPGGPVIDVDFDGLVVDETKTRGALIFRLAESTNAILVHESLRDHLVASGFDKLEFLEPEDTAL